jgi:hypothetical protein
MDEYSSKDTSLVDKNQAAGDREWCAGLHSLAAWLGPRIVCSSAGKRANASLGTFRPHRAPDLTAKFFSNNGHSGRCRKSEPDPLATDRDHGYVNVVTDQNLFTSFATQDQHFLPPENPLGPQSGPCHCLEWQHVIDGQFY